MYNFWSTPIEVRTDTLVGMIIVFSVFVWYCFDYYDGITEQQKKFDMWRSDNDKYRISPENQLKEYYIHLRNTDKIKIN